VKLGFNKQLGTGKIHSLYLGVNYNRGGLCIIHGFGTEKCVRYNWEFVITEFVITKFVITEFVITEFVKTEFVITEFYSIMVIIL
jgi:hypothetical protein